MKNKVSKLYLREIVITIVIMTYNDSAIIENVLKKTNDILHKNYPNYEIIIVDNNSKDNTLKKITDLYKNVSHLKIIHLSKTYAVDLAYTAGLDNCVGDYCILIDPHIAKPDIIPVFMNKLFEGYDIVSLSPKISAFNRWSASQLCLSLIETLSKNKFIYEPIHLLGFNRKVINSFTRIRRKNRNFMYISNAVGFSKVTIDSLPGGIIKGNYPNVHFFEFLLSIFDIIISNSFKLLRLMTILGVIFSFMTVMGNIVFLILGYIFKTYLVDKTLLLPTMVISIMFFFLFSLLAVLSEYSIRILEETRNEPLYFVASEMDKSIITTRNDFNIV